MGSWRAVRTDGAVGAAPVRGHVEPAGDEPGTDVLLLRDADGVLHATDVACPHLGQPLTLGELEGDTIACDHHRYRYALDDGHCVEPGGPLAGRLAIHEVREDEHGIRVRLVEDA